MAPKPKKKKVAPATVALQVRVKKGRGSIVMFDPTAPEKPERVVMQLPGRALPKKKNVKRLDPQSKELGKLFEKAFQVAVKRAIAG